MFESSLFIHWLTRPVQYIIKLWQGSLTLRLLNRLAAWFLQVWHHSAIINWVKKDGFLVRFWEHSAALKFVDWLANLIPNLLGKVYTRMEQWFHNSLLYRLVAFLTRHVAVLIAVFVLAAFLIPYPYWDNRYSTVAVLILFGLFLLQTMADRDVKFVIKAMDLFLFLFLLSIVLAQAFSTYPSLSLRFLVFYGTDFLMMLLLVSTIKTREQLSTVLEIILVGVALVGLYGFYQGIRGVPVIQSQVDVDLNEGMPGRVFSIFDNSNVFAQVIVMFVPFFASVVLNAKSWQKKVLFGLTAVPSLIALLMTYSRSGYIGLAVAALVFVFLIKRSLVPLLAAMGILALPFLPDTVLRRIATITNLEDSSVTYRFDIFRTMWMVIKDFWYTGIGLGSDAVKRVTESYEVLTEGVPLHAHNLYLQIWLETGMVGVLSFVGWMVRAVKKSLRVIYNKKADPYLKNVLKAGVSGLLGLLVIALVEYIWYYPRVMMMFWILLGLIMTAIKLAFAQETQKEQRDA